MAEIFTSVGKTITKSGLLTVTKSIGGIVITTDKDYATISAEKIKIEVERSGNNLAITNGFMPLKDLILLNTMFDGALSCDEAGNVQVIINFAIGGALRLGKDEILKIELESLTSAKIYIVDTLEDFFVSDVVTTYERKTMSTEEATKEFYVTEYAALTIDNTEDIQEITLKSVTGTVVKHNMRELRAIARSIDPIAAIDKGGLVKSSYSDRLQFPLVGVVSFEIRKAQTKALDIYLRKN